MKKLITVLFLLFPAVAWCAPQTFIINEAGTGDYTNLETALNDREDDYTGSAGGSITFRIEGVWNSSDTLSATLHNYTLGPSSGVIIEAVGDARHNGKWTNTAYRLVVDTDTALRVFNYYVEIKGLQIASGKNDAQLGAYNSDAGSILFDGNILTHVGEPLSGKCGIAFDCNTYGRRYNIRNNIIYGFSAYDNFAISLYGNSEVYADNNTMFATNRGFMMYISTMIIVRNNITANQGYMGYYSQQGFHALSSNNIAEDDSSPNVDFRNKSITFVDEAIYDLHISSTETDAIGMGSDLSSLFTTDIDGDVWGPWGIGADMYAASEPSIQNLCIRFKGKLRLR